MGRPWDKKRGSGWFWLLDKQGNWTPLYVNALWGVRLDGYYVRPDNFIDAVGPIFPPAEGVRVIAEEAL